MGWIESSLDKYKDSTRKNHIQLTTSEFLQYLSVGLVPRGLAVSAAPGSLLELQNLLTHNLRECGPVMYLDKTLHVIFCLLKFDKHSSKPLHST